MPQTATRPIARQALKPVPKAETPEERNMRLYGCPFDHTPNAETIAAFNEPASGPFDTLEEFFTDLYADDDDEHTPNAEAISAIEIAKAIRDGKLSHKKYNSLEDILADLHA